MPSPTPPWQFACAAYIPIVTANLSVLGSGLIIWSILMNVPRAKRGPNHRILMIMSAYDFQYSLAKGLTFLLAPRGYGVPGALGNMATCRLQGFSIELAYATGAYNSCLSLYYYLVICHGVRIETFERYIEPVMHVLISAIFWGFAITGVVIELFNPAFGFCFIASFPPGCGIPGGPPCERFPPESIGIVVEVFAQGWVQSYFVVVIYTQVAIWWNVRKRERITQKYVADFIASQSGENGENGNGTRLSRRGGFVSTPITLQLDELRKRRSRSRRERHVMVQSALYVGSFTACWIGPTCFHLADWIWGYKSFWAVFVLVIFTPLQGFWNLFIYLRPTYLRTRRKNMSWTRRQCAWYALVGKVKPMKAAASSSWSLRPSTREHKSELCEEGRSGVGVSASIGAGKGERERGREESAVDGPALEGATDGDAKGGGRMNRRSTSVLIASTLMRTLRMTAWSDLYKDDDDHPIKGSEEDEERESGDVWPDEQIEEDDPGYDKVDENQKWRWAL